MAIHSSVLAWRIPGTGEPGGLLSVGSHRVGHNCSDLAAGIIVYTFNVHLLYPCLHQYFDLKNGSCIFLSITIFLIEHVREIITTL